MGDVILEAIEISKTYPGVQALKAVHLTLRAGEVTALMGENGAGKSTLIRTIGGLEQPTSGELRFRGVPLRLHSAADSQAAGISVVSQEFRLVPQLTVAENIFLGHEVTRGGLIRPAESKRRARALLEQLGLNIDPGRTVESLAVGDQQLVEITRALSKDADVVVMDEPSAALNRGEVRRLLDLVKRLKEQGKAILYVSHRLDEIFEISERISVFRDGQSVGDLVTAETTESELVALMLGRELQSLETANDVHAVTADSPVRLSVHDFTCPKVPEAIELEVRRGEVLGVAGLVGSGRSELMQGLFGAIPSRGAVIVDGKTLKLRGPGDAIKAGVFMLGENRKAEGILPHLSVLENLLVSAKNKTGNPITNSIPVPKYELSTYQRLKQELRIRVDRPQQYIGNLSGGNQQKVLFGRALLTECNVLLLNEPTRGVDVGAKVEIYQLIRDVADSGVAVVVSSSDAPELVTLANRILVMRAGLIKVELQGEQITEDRIVSESVGTGRPTSTTAQEVTA